MRVAIVSAETFEHDSRGLRIARALAADGHHVQVLALSGEGLAQRQWLGPSIELVRVEVDRRITSALRPMPARVRAAVARAIGLDPEATILPASRPRGMGRLGHLLRRLLELGAHARRMEPWTDAVLAAAPKADLFQTKTLSALPVVRRAAGRLGARYVYDFADYQTEAARIARLPWVMRAAARAAERRWARGADGLLAVSPAIANLVAGRLAVSVPAIVLNCPPAWRTGEEEPPSSSRLRDRLGLSPERPIVLHHGQLKPDRGIEELVAAASEPALQSLDPAVVFMGDGRLRQWVAAAAARSPTRVFVLPPVPPDELLDWICGADVCYLGCPPRTLNLRLTLPNKLFEALMAGVPVVAARSTEQGRIVARERVGRTTNLESPRTLAEDLGAILRLPADERLALRRRCRAVALTKYSWELNAAPLLELYRRLRDETESREAPA